jgi:hypothetical protein
MPKLLDRFLEKGKYLFNFSQGKTTGFQSPQTLPRFSFSHYLLRDSNYARWTNIYAMYTLGDTIAPLTAVLVSLRAGDIRLLSQRRALRRFPPQESTTRQTASLSCHQTDRATRDCHVGKKSKWLSRAACWIAGRRLG